MMLRNPFHQSAVDLPRAVTLADPSRAAGLPIGAAVLAGLPVETVAGLARRAALNAQALPLAPYPAPKKGT